MGERIPRAGPPASRGKSGILKLFVGPAPELLADLTMMIEVCMIARARAKSWIVKSQESDSNLTSPIAQRGLKGYTTIYPQQPDELAEVLPPPVGETLTFICVILVGSSKLAQEWLRENVMCSMATSLSDLAVLRGFDSQIGSAWKRFRY